jgi:hypothetical protein
VQKPPGLFESPLNRRTEHNIHVYSAQSREAINQHILQLENEWSIERVMEASASLLALIGIALGAFVSPWFLILPALIGAFFLANAAFRFRITQTLLQGKGMRTNCEINTEKFAMKSLRSECDALPSGKDKTDLAERTIAAARAYSSDT